LPTAVEASINLYYSSLGNTEEKIASYFKDYISNERDQNRKWLSAVNAAKFSAEAKQHHLENIARKEEALRKYERVLTQFYSQLSLDYVKIGAPWPSLFDRFKSIGKEIDYRTVYSALCSQAHNDAEDLLNDFVSKAFQIEGISERQERENASFALLMILISVETLVESAAIYLGKYSLGANETLLPLHRDLQRVMQRLSCRPELGSKRNATHS
jgi:hypothetical protein